MALEWKHGALADGLACYRRQEFFATHEHWEGEWVRAAEPEKTFLQALIHVSVAMHHQKGGNSAGAIRQLDRALRKLASYPADFGGIDVGALRESIRVWLKALNADEPISSIPVPTIR